MGKFLFSAATGGFYHTDIHASAPDDAVEITDEVHAELMAAQATGKFIVPGEGGAPVAADPPAPTEAELAASLRRERNNLLTASDWTQMPDSPLSDDLRAEWATYRQALRDLPETVDDWAAVEWPTPPGAD